MRLSMINNKRFILLLLTTFLATTACQLDPSSYEPDASLNPDLDMYPPIAGSMSNQVDMEAIPVAGTETTAGTEPEAGAQVDIGVSGEVIEETDFEIAGETDLGAGNEVDLGAGDEAGNAMLPPSSCLVAIQVQLPASTPMNASIYLASEQFEPEWLPNDAAGLLEVDGNQATGNITFPNFTNIAYKFTLGDWSLAEVNPDCSEATNRFTFVQCDGDEPFSLSATVEAWQGQGDCL